MFYKYKNDIYFVITKTKELRIYMILSWFDIKICNKNSHQSVCAMVEYRAITLVFRATYI